LPDDSAAIVPERSEQLAGDAVGGPMPSIPSGRGRPRPQVRSSPVLPHVGAHALAEAHAAPFAPALTSPDPERPASTPTLLPNEQSSSAKVLAPEPSTASLGPTVHELPAGRVAPEGVAQTVRAHAGEVRACLERARMDRADLHGRLTVHATLSPAGRVLSASAAGFEGGARLDRCVVSAFQSWTFPAPSGGVPGQIAYAFVFE
jgi:outer membrane biosynthesis protein TonB